MIALLERMRAGDRQAAATFVERYEGRLRRRIHGKLARMRRLFDTEDIISTFRYRLDRLVHSGRVRAANEEQLWSLVFTMVTNAIVDRTRVYDRLQRVEAEDSDFAHELVERLREADRDRRQGADELIARALSLMESPADHQMLAMWLNGSTHVEIADVLGMSWDTARQRWRRIKGRLRRDLAKAAER